NFGYSDCKRVAIVERSACACPMDTPGFRRPKTSIMRVSRCLMWLSDERYGHAEVGMNTSVSTGYCGIGGSTPTTVWTLSFISKVLPATLGSAPNLLRQYSLLS